MLNRIMLEKHIRRKIRRVLIRWGSYSASWMSRKPESKTSTSITKRRNVCILQFAFVYDYVSFIDFVIWHMTPSVQRSWGRCTQSKDKGRILVQAGSRSWGCGCWGSGREGPRAAPAGRSARPLRWTPGGSRSPRADPVLDTWWRTGSWLNVTIFLSSSGLQLQS